MVINDNDTFILQQLMTIRNLGEPSIMLEAVRASTSSNMTFFKMMDNNAREAFKSVASWIILDLELNNGLEALHALNGFIISFLGDCIKRAEHAEVAPVIEKDI